MLEAKYVYQRIGLPLKAKVVLAQQRLQSFYSKMGGSVYISFSGGKDSLVLADIARKLYPKIPVVFIDTGLEYPEVRKTALSYPNVTVVRPKMTFKAVIEKYGYPVVSKDVAQKIQEIRTTKSDKLRDKRLYGDANGNGKLPEKWKFLLDAPFSISGKCCDALKKGPAKRYEKETGNYPIVGTMATDGMGRWTSYLKTGCNTFEGARPMSRPLSIWTEENIWEYIKDNDLPYASIYDLGYTRTGCMFCLFGLHMEEQPGRFDRMKESHPELYKYCMVKLGLKEVINYLEKQA